MPFTHVTEVVIVPPQGEVVHLPRLPVPAHIERIEPTAHRRIQRALADHHFQDVDALARRQTAVLGHVVLQIAHRVENI